MNVETYLEVVDFIIGYKRKYRNNDIWTEMFEKDTGIKISKEIFNEIYDFREQFEEEDEYGQTIRDCMSMTIALNSSIAGEDVFRHKKIVEKISEKL